MSKKLGNEEFIVSAFFTLTPFTINKPRHKNDMAILWSNFESITISLPGFIFLFPIIEIEFIVEMNEEEW